MQTDLYRLDEVLEAAVMTHWSELMPKDERGLIHLEYDFGENGMVNYFQIWSSTVHGHWHLVCTYDTSALRSSNATIHVENAYSIDKLSGLLNLIMQHEDKFLPTPSLGRQGLLQVTMPTQTEAAEAAIKVHEALGACNLLEAQNASV